MDSFFWGDLTWNDPIVTRSFCCCIVTRTIKKKKIKHLLKNMAANSSANHSSVKLDLKKTLFKTRNVACQRTPFGVTTIKL